MDRDLAAGFSRENQVTAIRRTFIFRRDRRVIAAICFDAAVLFLFETTVSPGLAPAFARVDDFCTHALLNLDGFPFADKLIAFHLKVLRYGFVRLGFCLRVLV
ncbi:hypothetical protein [Bradyrhizobium guangdongense]|uniref:hypothetical protein n=1 Tax=Bradyrhizobium guangdongense TaxID=1325090 RepID=UPI00112D87D3|nr:hypothetical protein [Bradyrhizobium guangdongense]